MSVKHTYTLVCSDSVYNPLVEDLRTTKQPSLSPCFNNDSARWRDMSPTYHLKCEQILLSYYQNKPMI